MANLIEHPPVPLGDFELHQPIGEGALGQVWSGIHTPTQTPVAVKILTHEGLQDSRFIEGFRHEVRTVAGLNHPSVVMIYDYGEIGEVAMEASRGVLPAKSPFFAMELASGGTLSDEIYEQDRISWARQKEVLLELLDGLAHSHARGIVHRDLKPSNVLLCVKTDARPGVKLADFHLALPTDDHDAGVGSGAISGTPPYMAPELLRGRWRDYGPWTDLYALGCIAFEMATGYRAFSGGSLREIVRAHLEGNRQPFRQTHQIPADFKAWLDGLMARDPRSRYRRAADAALALRELRDPAEVDQTQATVANINPQVQTISSVFESDTSEAMSATLSSISQTVEQLSSFQSDVDTGDLEDPNALQLRFENPPSRAPVLTYEPPAPPEGWERDASSAQEPGLSSAGLALFGQRSIPMVDREDERHQLWRTMKTVWNERQARLVLLSGPSGFGKSRLAEWLCQRAHELGVANPARALHAPLPGPSDGMAPMLTRMIRAQGLDRTEVVGHCFRWLRDRGSNRPDDAHALTEIVKPATRRDIETGMRVIRFASPVERFAVIYRVLRVATRRRPLIVWIDDAQWGAEALEFVRYATSEKMRRKLPVLFVGTVREEELAERPFEAELLASLSSDTRTKTIGISALPEAHRDELIGELLGLEPALAERVVERTAGNPLFAVQLVGDWVKRALLTQGPQGLCLADGATVDLPDDIHMVWEDRVQNVFAGQSQRATTAIELAAVLGQYVSGEEWQTLCEMQQIPVPKTLVETLFMDQLAKPDDEAGDGSWAFVHRMLTESIVRRAREAGREPEHHQACAEMLTTLDSEVHAERIGRHFLSAGLDHQALSPLIIAADKRHQDGDYRRAALLLEERNQAMNRLGLSDEDELRVVGWVLQVRCMGKQVHADKKVAEQIARRAVNTARKQGLHALHAEALAELASLQITQRQLEDATASLAAAKELSNEAMSADVRSRFALVSGSVAAHDGRLDDAKAALEEAREGFERLGDPYMATAVLVQLSTLMGRLNRLEDSDAYATEALKSAKEVGAALFIAESLNGKAEVSRHEGRLEEARAYYEEARDIAVSIEHRNVIVYELNLGLILSKTQRYDDAREIFNEQLTRVKNEVWGSLVGVIHCLLLPCCAAANDWEAFDRHLKAAVEAHSGSQSEPDAARSAQHGAMLAASDGEVDRARGAYELAETLWQTLGFTQDARRVREALLGLDT